MSTSNMLWNMVKALYFFGCMTVACAQLSAAGSLAAAGGLSATNIPIGDELLETNTGGRLRHGHRLNRAGRRPRLYTNTSRSYKQLLIRGIYQPCSCVHASGFSCCFRPSCRLLRPDAWSVETSSTSYRTLKKYSNAQICLHHSGLNV